MYSHADVLILDDPMSALDPHVGAHIFDDGIVKFALKRKRTVILVTHQLQYLGYAHSVGKALFLPLLPTLPSPSTPTSNPLPHVLSVILVTHQLQYLGYAHSVRYKLVILVFNLLPRFQKRTFRKVD